jgi:flavin-dependent dehydrogenase
VNDAAETRRTWDVLVAGGGPAGLAAAIAARLAGMDVLVVEPRDGVIDKACGEGLLPHGVEALKELGVAPLQGIPLVGIRYLLARDVRRVAEGRFPGASALGVRRTTLHGAMRARADALGVRFVRDRIERLRELAGPGLVVASGRDAYRARWLVGADGLRSRVRREAGLASAGRGVSRLGLRMHHRVAPWTDLVEVTFAPGVEAYVTPVADDMVGVAFLFETPAPYDVLLARFPALAARLAGARPASRLRGSGPFEQRSRASARGRVLLVGDAAGYVDPLTGEGVALGVVTARAAVACIQRGERGDDVAAAYARAHRAIVGPPHALTRALLAVARRPWLHGALVALAGGAPWAFDAALGVLAACPADRVRGAPLRGVVDLQDGHGPAPHVLETR